MNCYIGHDPSEEWIDTIDRGGLIHISLSGSETKGVKEKVMKNLLESDDVLFFWDIVSASWAEEESAEVLKLIGQLYVVFPMPAYSWGNANKSKTLRKKLCFSFWQIFLVVV